MMLFAIYVRSGFTLRLKWIYNMHENNWKQDMFLTLYNFKIWEWKWNLKEEYVMERRIILKTESWKEGRQYNSYLMII